MIEAKSPKDVEFPFHDKYIVQGLQYCIHPEIQAKYLVLSNGLHTSVYDAYGAVFLGQDIFEPILTFTNAEVSTKWPGIYQLLSVETLRKRIEIDLKKMYEKLCLSTLDKNYPEQLIRTIGSSRYDLSRKIEKEVARLNVEALNESLRSHQDELSKLSSQELYQLMGLPLGAGKSVGQHFSERCIAGGKDLDKILNQLTHDFATQSIFRKEQPFVGVCIIYQNSQRSEIKTKAKTFLDQHKDGRLSMLNLAECLLLRLTRKLLVINVFPKLREMISKKLESSPEIVKFIRPPSALTYTFEHELTIHQQTFKILKAIPDESLQRIISILEDFEPSIEKEFKQASSKLPDTERQLCGFEYYGKGGIHWPFRNILHNLGIEKRQDI